MRLLHLDNDGNVSLVEFIGNHVPPYAILSHTWSQTSQEVSFAAFQSGDYKLKAEYVESYSKIRRCGKQARRDDLQYFWVDTCCIDKQSSAELSEAINSMYTWYGNANICYAYLSDVYERPNFEKSRWFKRGWTLQELLAPIDVLFFDASWSAIGFKSSLTESLSKCTGVDISALSDGSGLGRYSIAKRLSWAAHRQTSRIEDEAYCLMGLFDVSMPLIYGEGRRAFVRLQEELLRKSDDASLFAYVASDDKQPRARVLSLPERVQREESAKALSIFEKKCPTDEGQSRHTTGLFSTSPIYFQLSADFISHPVLNETLRQQKGPNQAASRIRRSGHLIKFLGLFWNAHFMRSRIPEYLEWTDRSFQEDITTRYGIRLTLSSARKLRICAGTNVLNTCTVAFLDCRRRNGGIIGIILHQEVDRGTYTRLHFPSIIETESSFFESTSALEARVIYIEANMLNFGGYSSHTLSSRGPPIWHEILIRTINFQDFDLSEEPDRLSVPLLNQKRWYRKQSGIPCIDLRFRYERGRSDLVCSLYPTPDGNYDYSRTAIGQSFIARDRSHTASLSLNQDLQLIVESRLQWDSGNAHGGLCGNLRYCLVSLTITQKDKKSSKDVLLEDHSLHAQRLHSSKIALESLPE